MFQANSYIAQRCIADGKAIKKCKKILLKESGSADLWELRKRLSPGRDLGQSTSHPRERVGNVLCDGYMGACFLTIC